MQKNNQWKVHPLKFPSKWWGTSSCHHLQKLLEILLCWCFLRVVSLGQTNYATPTPGLTNDVRSQFIGEVVSSFVAFNPSEKYVFVNLDHFHQRLQKNDTHFFSRHKWIKNLSEKSLNTVGSFDPIPSFVPFGAERIDTTWYRWSFL